MKLFFILLHENTTPLCTDSRLSTDSVLGALIRQNHAPTAVIILKSLAVDGRYRKPSFKVVEGADPSVTY